MNVNGDKSLIPFRFEAGKSFLKQWTASRGNALIDAINMNRISSVTNMRLDRKSTGTALGAEAKGSDSIASDAFPFKVYKRSTDTVAKIAVNDLDGFVGQVNSFTPQIGGIDIGTSPTPLLELVNITSSGVIYLNCTVDPGADDVNITGITVEEDTDLPDNTDTNCFITIATINSLTYDPKPTFIIANAIINSLTHQRCGAVDLFFGA